MVEKLDNFVALKSFTKSELKFIIGDREFSMKPLSPNKLRIIVELVETGGKSLSGVTNFNDILKLVLDKIIVIFPVIFNEKIDQEFIDNHFSIPLCVEIWEQLVKLNMIEGIIPFLKEALKVTKTPLQEK